MIIKILMPQNFKFVLLLFDYNVERLQVKPIEIHRIPKIYTRRNEESYFVCTVFYTNYITYNLDISD